MSRPIDIPPRLREPAFWLATVARDVRDALRRIPAPGDAPTDFNIEPSNLCNANCVFCAYQHQTRDHQSIDLALALKIIDAARHSGVRRIGLTPIVGEPLVNRELEEIIRYARSSSTPLDVGVTTNGLLLNATRYLSLVGAGVTDIAISMTYPDAQEYARIYRNNSFRILIRNLESVLDVYQPSQCSISIGVRSPRNDALDHPLFARTQAAGWRLEKNVFFDDWSGSVREGLIEHGLAARPAREKRLPCTMLFSGPHFLSDGRATACGCRDVDGTSELALDADELLRDARSVYASGKVAELRQRFRDGDAPAICQSCRHYNPQIAGESAFLKAQQILADARKATAQQAPRMARRQLTVL